MPTPRLTPRGRRVVQVRKEPKGMSIGVFVAAVLWVLGAEQWGIGYNIWFLLGVCVLSFIVDRVCTGFTHRRDVYID